jgi:hypothetical protein
VAARTVLESVTHNLVRDWLNHTAGFFRALALVQTDVLMLQGYMLVSSNITIFRLARRGEMTATAYAILFASLSAYATFALVQERFVWLDDREAMIWAHHFEMLTQPMFRKLMSCAEIRTVPRETRQAGEADLKRATSPAPSDASSIYECEGVRALSIGGEPTLSLLLSGKVRIVRNVARDDGEEQCPRSSHTAAADTRRAPSVKPVLIERGPGFCGEVRSLLTPCGPPGADWETFLIWAAYLTETFLVWAAHPSETLLVWAAHLCASSRLSEPRAVTWTQPES